MIDDPMVRQRVMVVQRSDDTIDEDLLGAIGQIVAVDFEHGCGEVPGDPLVEVVLLVSPRPPGAREHFWREELADAGDGRPS